MRHDSSLATRALVITAILWLSPAASIVWAAAIKLDDGTTVKGDILQVDDDQVIVGLSRQSIATLDGKPLPPTLKEGVAAPAFAVKDLLGHPQVVGGANGRLTLLHFWVHWCPHCRSDAPKIQALYNQFRDNPKVRILTVNLDQDRALVDRFINEHQVSYPVILAAEQASGSSGVDLPQLYQVTGFPVTYLIDAQGIIRYKARGSFAESGVDLAARVAALLSTDSALP